MALKLCARGQDHGFYYGKGIEALVPLYEHGDAKWINPEKVGGMVGTLLGMFASGNGTESGNEASFDWFLYQEMKQR